MKCWIDRLIRAGSIERGVLFEADDSGTVVAETHGADVPVDAVVLGVASAGFANAHSHAFHRALRGRTHESGSFWTWRDLMYRAATRLTPENYRELASAVFKEMVVSGWTSVGEFHYVHHEPDGTPYRDHAMELALADAASAAGIRLVLLDTLYLTGGIGRPLSAEQARFSDRSVDGWLDRWFSLRDALTARSPFVTLGAALHSVRAVPRGALGVAARSLPAEVPLHIHLSEQPAENEASILEYGLTPTELLHAEGVLAPRLSVVHATHLTHPDIAMLADAGTTAIFCPTTEADLGDGIGPARELTDAGVALAMGSDQNAVVDPMLELRGLEAGERLRAMRRGRFSPEELWRIGSRNGYTSLGLGIPATVGGPLDLVEWDAASIRTAGSKLTQLPLTATAGDVLRTAVGGRVVTHDRGATAHALGRIIEQLFQSM